MNKLDVKLSRLRYDIGTILNSEHLYEKMPLIGEIDLLSIQKLIDKLFAEVENN